MPTSLPSLARRRTSMVFEGYPPLWYILRIMPCTRIRILLYIELSAGVQNTTLLLFQAFVCSGAAALLQPDCSSSSLVSLAHLDDQLICLISRTYADINVRCYLQAMFAPSHQYGYSTKETWTSWRIVWEPGYLEDSFACTSLLSAQHC